MNSVSVFSAWSAQDGVECFVVVLESKAEQDGGCVLPGTRRVLALGRLSGRMLAVQSVVDHWAASSPSGEAAVCWKAWLCAVNSACEYGEIWPCAGTLALGLREAPDYAPG